MEQLDATAYQPMIDAILGVADLEKITVKKIRNALSELFSIDLVPHKKQMNDFILQRYYALTDEKEEEEERNQEPKEKPPNLKRVREDTEEDDWKLAERLQDAETGRKTRAGPKKAKKTKSAPKRTPNTAFNAELAASNALQEVIGQPRMSRPMVVKKLWEYIKAHNLQDPNDKRRISCDEKLLAVFKKNSVGMFEMNRLLGSHLFKDGELVDGSTAKQEPVAPKEEMVSDLDSD